MCVPSHLTLSYRMPLKGDCGKVCVCVCVCVYLNCCMAVNLCSSTCSRVMQPLLRRACHSEPCLNRPRSILNSPSPTLHHCAVMCCAVLRWYLGIQSKKDPAHVMTEVYKAMLALRYWVMLCYVVLCCVVLCCVVLCCANSFFLLLCDSRTSRCFAAIHS